MKKYLFSYNYKGDKYSLEIPANTIEEARGRLSRMAFARYDGEVIMEIPSLPGSGFLISILYHFPEVALIIQAITV